MGSLKIILLSFAMLSIFGAAAAQEVAPMAEVSLDEDVQSEDLEVSEPRILPDSPLYFFKNWGRGIQTLLTFNPVAKTELRQKFANEKLIELKRMIEKNKGSRVIGRATENYQKEVEKVKEAAEKIREKASENPRVDKFLNKFVKQQILHQRILQKLENQVPEETFQKIKKAREKHLEKFGEVMTKLEDRKEQLAEKLEKNLEEMGGSKFKNFKNLEVLMELEERVPGQAKEAIKRAQENALKRLKGDLEKMSPANQERFKEYIGSIGGAKEKHIEILENLREELKEKPAIMERILESREKIMEKIQERVEERNCPSIEKLIPGFCQEGRLIVKKDEKGCVISFECLTPAERELPKKPEGTLCITLWDPVCGKDGKTYSNKCFAEAAKTEIAHEGACREGLQKVTP